MIVLSIKKISLKVATHIAGLCVTIILNCRITYSQPFSHVFIYSYINSPAQLDQALKW